MKRPALTLQTLESRDTPAAPVVTGWLLTDGTLLIQGTDAADTIVVRETAAGQISVAGMKIKYDNLFQDSIPAARVTAIEVQGLGGDDTIKLNSESLSGYVALSKPASAWGGDGNDLLVAGRGGMVLGGEVGNDTLLGGDGNDELYGDVGNDVLMGGAGDDQLIGGPEVLSGPDDDTLDGGTGNDLLWGGAGNDILRGGAGNDQLMGGAGNDKMYGEAGNDRLWGDAGNDLLRGGDGNDILQGGAGNDALYGDAGNDHLWGDAGADYMDGGLGVNYLDGYYRTKAMTL